MSGASSVSMFAGFITSGSAGAEVYGVTFNTLNVVHQAISISRDPDIYEMNIFPTSGASPFQARTIAPGDIGLQMLDRKPRDSMDAALSNS